MPKTRKLLILILVATLIFSINSFSFVPETQLTEPEGYEGESKYSDYEETINISVTFNETMGINNVINGEYLYWYNFENHAIGFDNERKIYSELLKDTGNNTGFTSGSFSSYLSYARGQWQTSGKISTSVVTSKEASSIEFYGGTRESLVRIHKGFEDTDVIGLCIPVSQSLAAINTYQGQSKYNYQMYKTIVGVVYHPQHTLNNNRMLFVHELGHGLGWKGHSNNVNDVMYRGLTEVYQLSLRDIRHLQQNYYTYVID